MSRYFALSFLYAALSVPAMAQTPGLVVKMGETWIFSLANGQPANAHAAPPGSKPGPNELMVSLKPQIGSTMIVTNNTDRFLNYRATIIAPNGERPTSVCTLMSGGRAGFENWHGNIAAIRLSDFSPAEDNKMVCQ